MPLADRGLTGTPYDFWIDGGIWFWEDVDETAVSPRPNVDHTSGCLVDCERIRGVVIGKLKNCGSEAEIDCAAARVFRLLYRFRLCATFPFGHYGDNLLMPIGARVRLSTQDGTFTVMDPAVER